MDIHVKRRRVASTKPRKRGAYKKEFIKRSFHSAGPDGVTENENLDSSAVHVESIVSQAEEFQNLEVLGASNKKLDVSARRPSPVLIDSIQSDQDSCVADDNEFEDTEMHPFFIDSIQPEELQNRELFLSDDNVSEAPEPCPDAIDSAQTEDSEDGFYHFNMILENEPIPPSSNDDDDPIDSAHTEDSEDGFNHFDMILENDDLREILKNINPPEPIAPDPIPPSSTNDDDPPLYPASLVTQGMALVLIVTYAIKHKLTGDAITQLLTLISLLLPQRNILKRTIHELKTYFKGLRNPVVHHTFCSKCTTMITDKTSKQCPNTLCNLDLTDSGSLGTFMEIPLETQVQNMFSRKGYYNAMQHRFTRTKMNENGLEDIYDGKLYKEKYDNHGVLSDPNNISFILNTDGVPLFKSSKMSLWPLYLVINELPLHLRYTTENMILAGLWFGETKPPMWSFLKPTFDSLRKLEDEGIVCLSPEFGSFTCRAILLAGSFDLPARAMVCNHMQFNGKFGCWKCLQPGSSVKTKKGGHVHAFEFKDFAGNLRSHEQVLNDASEAVQTSSTVRGMKGFSWLMFLNSFDVVRGISIDYMHGILLGVTKLLLVLLFAQEHSKEKYSARANILLLDQRLAEIKPVKDISRVPRAVSTHLKYWKASELKSFLLYYCGPCLQGLIPVEYFRHFLLLSHATYLLCKDSILPVDLQAAEADLQDFCEQFSTLYSNRHETLNVHQLLHVARDVQDLGPLFTHSCFYFEDKNNTILNLIHGTQHIQDQLSYSVSLVQNLPDLARRTLVEDSLEHSFYKDLTQPRACKSETKICDSIWLLGATRATQLSEDEVALLTRSLGFDPPIQQALSFKRIRKNKVVYHSKAYKRVTARNNFTIAYKDRDEMKYGQILKFVQITLNSCTGDCLHSDVCTCKMIHNLAVVDTLPVITTLNQFTVVSHSSGMLQYVPLHSLVDVCVFMSSGDSNTSYICHLVNRIEND